MIKPEEYRHRRKQMMRIAGEDAIIIVPASPQKFRNGDVAYRYRQNSDFYYLTGFAEPDAVLVLLPGHHDAQTIMFCRKRDQHTETWDGPMAGLEGAQSDYGMDLALDIATMDDRLPDLLRDRERVFYTFGLDVDFDQQLMSCINEVRQNTSSRRHAPAEYVSLDHFLHDMRLYKSRKEITCMSSAAKISVAAHQRAMQACRPGMHEYQLAAELHYEYHLAGTRPAYLPIVGGGHNACIMHYINNSDVLNDGDLVLIDAGAEYDCYAADITRTYPVNGRFSAEQKALYEVVLASQLAAIEQVYPGSDWEAPHNAAVAVIAEGLVDLGILGPDVDAVMESGSYRDYYMHKTGHWLGLDVHDVGDYQVDKQPRMLESGMALTVEPGVYIRPNDNKVDERWRGIGIRIEDDVVVTSGGHRVLSKQLVKAADDIEAFMNQ